MRKLLLGAAALSGCAASSGAAPAETLTPSAAPVKIAAPAATVSAATSAAVAQVPRLTLRKGDAVQGGLTFWATEPGATVTLDGEEISVDADGNFVVGFSRDFEGEATIKVVTADGRETEQEVAVEDREFRISRIDGVPERTVNPYKEEDLAQIREESALKKAARANPTDEPYWRAGFAWPAKGRISSVYGSQRIYNGTPRRFHSGTDIAAPPGVSPMDYIGTEVRAPSTGRVTLAREGMFFEGGLIFIDHGQGLESALLHMVRVDVEPGQLVTKGEVIGAVGMEGRATGPHLHWTVNWRGEPMDAELLVPPMDLDTK